MDYDLFMKLVAETLQDRLGAHTRVKICSCRKNNREEQQALCIMPEGKNASPAIYLKPYYRKFCSGGSLRSILDQILEEYRQASDLSLPLEDLTCWEKMKNRIGARLVSSQGNAAFLSQLPHRLFLDLALTYYIRFDDKDSHSGICTITDMYLDMWGVQEQDLYQASRENLPKLFPPDIMSVEDMLFSMMPDLMGRKESGRTEARQFRESSGPVSLYVITNRQRYMGAVALFYENLLEDFLEHMGWEAAYVLPSSIHEVLVLPKKDSVDPEDLRCMVQEVNNTAVEAEEFLSWSVYLYDRTEKRLRLAGSDGENREEQIFGRMVG